MISRVVPATPGGLHVLLDRMLPLAEAASALAHLAEGRVKGKIILVANRVV